MAVPFGGIVQKQEDLDVTGPLTLQAAVLHVR